MQHEHKSVAEWLNNLPNIRWAMNCRVTIRGKEHFGAIYYQYDTDSPRIYLLGNDGQKLATRQSFTLDESELYIAYVTAPYAEFHPFGPNFILLARNPSHGPLNDRNLKTWRTTPINLTIEYRHKQYELVDGANFYIYEGERFVHQFCDIEPDDDLSWWPFAFHVADYFVTIIDEGWVA